MKKDDDFYGWSMEVAEQVRSERPELAEFMEFVGKSQLRELKSRLRVLILHMLKWEFQPDKRTPSWTYTLIEQRDEIESLLEDSPSLAGRVLELAVERYDSARTGAAVETGLDLKIFPNELPYSLNELLKGHK